MTSDVLIWINDVLRMSWIDLVGWFLHEQEEILCIFFYEH